MGKMNGKGEGTRARTQHIRGTKRTTQVDWELSGRGKMNLTENEKQRVATRNCVLGDKVVSGKRRRTAKGLDSLMDSEDLKYIRQKKKTHKNTRQ